MKNPPSSFALLLLAFLASTGSLCANTEKPEGSPGENSPTDQKPVICKICYPPQEDRDDPGDPVVLVGGKFYYPALDVSIPGRGRATGVNLRFFRCYSSKEGATGVLGWGWMSNLDMRLVVSSIAPIFRDETGTLTHFNATGYVQYTDNGQQKQAPVWWSAGAWDLQAQYFVGPNSVSITSYEMVRKFGTKYTFDGAGVLLYIESPTGYRITYNRTNGKVTSLTDSSNRALTFTYNAAGFLASVSDQSGRIWTYTQIGADLTAVTYPLAGLQETYGYDTAHNCTDVKDRNGAHTTYAYNLSDQVAAKYNPDGTQLDFTFNNFLGTGSMVDEDGYSWSYEYVRVGLASNIIAPDGGLWHYEYNNANELIEIRDPLFGENPQRKTIYTWNPNHDLTAITEADGSARTFTYGLASHMIMSEKDGNNHTVTFGRDPQRRITSTTDARGKASISTYDALTGLVSTMTDRNVKVTAVTYNPHGDLSSIDGPVAGTADTVTFTYDILGRVTSRTDPPSRVTTVTWDALDRVTRVTRPDGTHDDFTYDANGNLLTAKDALNHGWTYTYDNRNRRTSATDQLNHTTTYDYTGVGLLLAIDGPLPGTVDKTTFEYDGMRRRTKVIEPAPASGGQPIVTTFAYNLAGELTTLTDGNGQATRFSFDPVTRIFTKSYADGVTESSSYDPAANLVSFSHGGASQTFAYNENNWLVSQNCPTCGVTFAYDDEGNRLQAVDALAGTYSWTYDAANRVSTSTQPGGTTGGAKTVTYGYDSAGRRASLTYPDGVALSYAYDSSSRLTQISQGTMLYQFTYDSAARRTRLTFPGGTYGDYTYDDGDRLTALNWLAPGTPPASLNANSYGYDAADALTSWSETHGSMSGARTFGYDYLQRLVSMSSTGYLGFGSRGYSFDAAGNRQAVTGTGATTYTMQPNMMNRYSTAGAAVLTYDLRGNLGSDGTRTMSYDAENRLTSVNLAGTTVNYTYDWAHRRAQRSAAGSAVRYLYDEDWNVLCDLDAATGALLTRYVHGPGVDEVLSQQSATATYYLCKNHLGSTTALISAATNAVTERYTYEEYGAPTVRQAGGYPSGSAPATRYLFTGREYDSTSGLYHYRHRWYHPGLGRWLSPDPLEDAEFVDGPNLYEYALNSPVRFFDPFGLQLDSVTASTPTPASAEYLAEVAEANADRQAARAAAEQCKRVAGKTLRKRWEDFYNKVWPKDPKTARNMDAAHKRALADKGTNHPTNIEPLPREVHVQRHKDAGDFIRWAKRAWGCKE